MLNLNAVYALLLREAKVFFREKERIISILISPLLFLFVMGKGMALGTSPVAGYNYQQFIFPGIVGMVMLFTSITYGLYIIWDKRLDFLKEVLAAPISRATLFVGKSLGGMLGAIVETHNNHTTINTYNISSWCGWPYPAYPCRYGYGGGCGGPMGSVNNWHGYGAIPPCGGWWYGDTKDSDLAKAIPELPIDSVAPSGAIVVTQNMARIVIRYGYRLPDESAVQKNLTILLDNDGDGFTNIDEWDNGTDPNNTNSFPVEVPNVVGMLVPEATTTLVGAHLLVGNLYPQPSSAPAGTVLASSPVAGTTVHSGSRVNLAVSDGTGGGTTTTVPDVRGKTVSEAQPIITGVDLVVGNVNQEHSATVAVGLIIRSNPIAGTSVPTGSSVDLVVSSGPIGQAEVRIVNPPSGNVYHIGDTVSLTIMVKGATGGGPYSLLVQNGELTKITIPLGDLGIQEVEVFPHSTFTFHFVSNGSLFMASLFDHSQKVAESDVPYSVIP